jgi:hypothetical protein
MDPQRQYTTQLQAGLGMVSETISLLRLWEPGDTAASLSQKAVSQGVFSRSTARRTLNIVKEMFAPRFLCDDARPARALKQLLDANTPPEDLSQLFFLHTARAQAVFADFVTDIYWPRYMAGASRITRSEAQTFIERALDSGRMRKRWTPASVRRVSAYLLGCSADFGLLHGSGRPNWSITRFAIRPAVANYLAHDLHFSGSSDFALTRHPDWRLFGLEPHEAVNQLKNLAHDGHLIIQAATDLVQITWKYKSMEECAHAIAQRQV